jgi:surfactin synthase thioesterase subunit
MVTFEVLPGKHMLLHEQPAQLIDAITRWLSATTDAALHVDSHS